MVVAVTENYILSTVIGKFDLFAISSAENV